jgi:glycosyltransferase involved in cell wall biosynthesis
MNQPALVTVVMPSLNHGRFLACALDSILEQQLPLEIILMDGGSSDETRDIISQYERHLFYWQSEPDCGQAAAINTGIERGSAPWVCWLNSDDFFYPQGLQRLLSALQRNPAAPFAFGHAWHVSETGRKRFPYLTLPYHEALLANYCGICQPATLIRRTCWGCVGGLDDSLNLAFDYDLWLRLVNEFGPPAPVKAFVAANRMHNASKTSSFLDRHYDESIQVVQRHFGRVPIKWRVLRPIMRKVRSLARFLRRRARAN